MNFILYKPFIDRHLILRNIINFKKIEIFNNIYKIGFIHITKTGGTDIKDKNQNSEIYFGKYHYENSSFYKNNLPCFAVIREPIERFKSTFFYNICGSSKYGYKGYDKIYIDINDFINDCIIDPNLLNSFEKGWQFRQQYKWLIGNEKNTFIIKYNNNNICNNISLLLNKEFNIDYKYNSNYIRINMTYYDNNINSNINEKNNKYLHDLYKEDFIIYNKLFKNTQPYIRFSEI